MNRCLPYIFTSIGTGITSLKCSRMNVIGFSSDAVAAVMSVKSSLDGVMASVPVCSLVDEGKGLGATTPTVYSLSKSKLMPVQ